MKRFAMLGIIIGFILAAVIFSVMQLTKTFNVGADKNRSKTKSLKNEKELDLKDPMIKKIYLAGGCFWGTEEYFSRVKGVVDVRSGYANGKTEETNYNEIKSTGHAETVEVFYNSSKVSLEEILIRYFNIIEPESLNKQGNDVGIQYRTGVYYTNEDDLKVIDKIFDLESKKYKDIKVEKEKLKNFVLAEDYHQDYLEKNPNGYCHIDLNGANKPIFDDKYTNPEDKEIKDMLDKLSYDVLRNSKTETPYSSELNDEYRRGIYVDKITGEPLFASQDKFDAGCGWPSFSKPILTDKIKYENDDTLGMNRVEVRSGSGDNHLGHVFDDGPMDKGGKRYCINGAALKFIPFEDMDKEGYSKYKALCK